MNIRVKNDFSQLDVYFSWNKGYPMVSSFYAKGAYQWHPITALQKTPSRIKAEIAALTYTLGTLTRNARIQLNGFSEISKALGKKHLHNKEEWSYLEEMLKNGVQRLEVGKNGKKDCISRPANRVADIMKKAKDEGYAVAIQPARLVDIVSFGDRLNTAFADIEKYAWTPFNHDYHCHAIATAVAPASLKAKAEPKPEVKAEVKAEAKVNPAKTATAKATKKAEANVK